MNRLHNFIVPCLLILIIATVEMATAIYTPSLPIVAEHFKISEALAQWTISLNLAGLALSGPIYGPLSDSYGRRQVLRWGMGLFLIGSLFSWAASSIEVLLIARFFQGLGAGVGIVVAFAVVRDLFDEKKSAQVLSYMGMAIALSPGIAPIVGSYLAYAHGWKCCFGVVSLTAALIVLILFLWMPETLPAHKRSEFSLKGIRRGYWKTLQNKRFMAYAMIPGIMIGAIWAWIAATPVLFINYLNVPLLHFGYYGFTGVAFYIMGAYVNSKLVHKFSLRSLLMVGLALCGLSTCALLLGGFMGVTPLTSYKA